jgi:hypothetical protein
MTDPQNPAEPTPPPAYSAAPPAQPYAPAPPAAYGPPASAAIPGRTLGIVAFVLSFFTGLIALILGIVALVQSKKAGFGNGWALAAIIISSVFLVLGIIVSIVLVASFGAVIQNSQ